MVNWLTRLRCLLFGHDDQVQPPHILSGVTCARCHRVTPGWSVTSLRHWKAKRNTIETYANAPRYPQFWEGDE